MRGRSGGPLVLALECILREADEVLNLRMHFELALSRQVHIACRQRNLEDFSAANLPPVRRPGQLQLS